MTRYFGGTLLGTGGLVRAYSAATKEGLANSTIITKYWGTKLLVNTDYNDIGKLQYLFGQREIPIMDAQYTEKVSFVVLIPVSRVEEIKKAVTEAVSGRAGDVEEVEQLFYALIDGEYICVLISCGRSRPTEKNKSRKTCILQCLPAFSDLQSRSGND